MSLSVTAVDIASTPASLEHRDADEWSGSESSGYASVMGVLSEVDGDGSDDEYGAAPLLQSPSKEIYQHSHSLQIDPPRLDQNTDGSDSLHQARQLEDELGEQTLHQAELEQLRPQQEEQCQIIEQEKRLIVLHIEENQEHQHQETLQYKPQEVPQHKSMDEQELARVSRIHHDHELQRQERQEQQQPPSQSSLDATILPNAIASSLLEDDEGHQDGAAAKFVFIATFGLTLCEDGRGYWYISAKVGDNRLPALVIGDVIRTVADTTARGWGADKMCASLDKGGVEIGIQRGLTAAMRFVTLPVADITGLQTAVAPATRHGLGFAFRRNEDSGALVVSSLREGSAAALCCCLEVGDVLLEV
jgi:hypothetical protein